MAAVCAVAWCAVFAAVHVYWAVGGSIGLASSAGPDLANRRPAAFVLFGLYGVALLLLAGATLVLLASRPGQPSRLSRTARVVVVAVGVVLLVRGVGLEVLLAINVGGMREGVGPLESRWSLIVWNPWFAIGGWLFLIAGQIRKGRRRSEPA